MPINTQTRVLLLPIKDAQLPVTIEQLCDGQAMNDYRLTATFVLDASLYLIFQK